MRRISFALTTDAVLARTKTVTRRMGWLFAWGELFKQIPQDKREYEYLTVTRIEFRYVEEVTAHA